MGDKAKPKQVVWIRSSRKDLQAMPAEVRRAFGMALFWAQMGGVHPDAKPMTGRLAGVMEIVEDFDGDTYRAMYTVKLGDQLYVLHAFKKKSTKGRSTPRHHVELVEQRFKEAKGMAKSRRDSKEASA